MRVRSASIFFSVLMVAITALGFPLASHGADRQLWVTMHTASIDNYCTPCIISERLLKEAHVEFTKVLEPMGPWPWFQLTDSQGNQRRLDGALSKEDIEAIQRGEFPERD
jgi:hypothetical protein